MQPAPLPCIACGSRPEPAFPETPPWSGGAPTQPYGATVFFANGQYGSTVYDPTRGDEHLIANVCDSCLRFAGYHGRVVRARSLPPKYSYEEWNPDEGN